MVKTLPFMLRRWKIEKIKYWKKLAAAMKDLKQKEQDLDDAFAIDVTAFKSDSEKKNYFKEIENKQAAYAASKAAVDAILADMAQVKSATIAAPE